jgi:hypothetical protein
MLGFFALALLAAAFIQVPQPEPQPQPSPPTAAPAATIAPAPEASTTPGASPLPTPTATPPPTFPPEPVRTPAPSPRPTPTLFAYVVDPPAGDADSPRIFEIAINDKTVHAGQWLLVKITTSPNVTSLQVRTLGHQMYVPNVSPGLFGGQQQLPKWIPGFLLNRTYTIDVIAATSDGRTTIYSLPLRLER